MASNQTYKAFTVRPSYVLDLNGVLLDSTPILSQLASEVRGISGYATYVVTTLNCQTSWLWLVLFRQRRLVVVRVLRCPGSS